MKNFTFLNLIALAFTVSAYSEGSDSVCEIKTHYSCVVTEKDGDSDQITVGIDKSDIGNVDFTFRDSEGNEQPAAGCRVDVDRVFLKRLIAVQESYLKMIKEEVENEEMTEERAKLGREEIEGKIKKYKNISEEADLILCTESFMAALYIFQDSSVGESSMQFCAGGIGCSEMGKMDCKKL